MYLEFLIEGRINSDERVRAAWDLELIFISGCWLLWDEWVLMSFGTGMKYCVNGAGYGVSGWPRYDGRKLWC